MRTRGSIILLIAVLFTFIVVEAGGQAIPKGYEKVSSVVMKRSVTFNSDNETLKGWLYLPTSYRSGDKLPSIVTANALTGVKEINLPNYAERFAEAGFATLIFDYRYWGESTGSPRHHIAPMEHRADIQNAVTFLAKQKESDSNRIGGWGISMGGGHMLFLATWEPRFKAVVAVSTGINPITNEEPLLKEAAQLRYKELLTVAKKERESRKNQNIVSLQAWCEAPGEGCALPVKEAFDYYMEAKNSYAPMFENKLSSTSFANMVADNVAFAIQFATAPILIVHPDKDLVPIEDVLFYYKRAPEPKRLVVPSGLHSTTYAYRKHFDMSAAEAVAWFKQYLGQ